MTETADPLQMLIAEDSQKIDKARLATFLRPYVIFDKDTHEIQFLTDYHSIISNEGKIEVLLVASKARYLLFNETEGMTPVEIIKLDLMPEGSVKSTIKKLNDGRKIRKDASGRYQVPNYRLNDIINRAK
jgi:hypothetical protein